MNIANLLVRAGAFYGKQPAVAFGDTYLLNYQELANKSAILANNLIYEYQLQPGERVALISANCPEFVELYFAIWHAGLVVVPINSKLHKNEFHYILEHSGAKICFTSEKLSPVIEPLVDEIDSLSLSIAIGSEHYTHLLYGERAVLRLCMPDDPAWLFYTSGTTGKPKGAMQSHNNLLTMTQCYLSDVDSIEVGDGIVHAAPMSHGGGYYMLPHVANGGINIVPKSGGFKEQELLELLAVHHNVSMFAAPTMVKRWVEYCQSQSVDLNHPFASLKTIIYGGGPMYQHDLSNAQQLLGNKLVQIYGQGECPMTITVLNKYFHQDISHPSYRERLASVGTAMTGIEIRIVDEFGHDVVPGNEGEIWVRGDAVMLGYFNDPHATAESISEGWLKTGDMAMRNIDGFITLVDRCKDVIISGGTNIYPREIEEVLNHHPGISESSVIGKKHQDWGEVVMAVVVPTTNNRLDVEELDRYCLDHMARFKRPKGYVFVNDLPKNNTGKILKTELRKRYA